MNPVDQITETLVPANPVSGMAPIASIEMPRSDQGQDVNRDSDRGARIIAARRARRWTRKQLANAADIRPEQVRLYEEGAFFGLHEARNLSAALGIDMLFLIHGRASPEPRDEQQIATGTPGPDLAESLSIHSSDDVKILENVAEFERLEREETLLQKRLDALPSGDERKASGLVDRINKMTDQQYDIQSLMPDLVAASRPALNAKLAMLRGSISFALRDLEAVSNHQHRTAWSILRDLANMAPSNPSSDVSNPILLDACARYDAFEFDYLGTYYGPGKIEDEDERDALNEATGRVEKQNLLLDIIKSTPARTLEEMRAKARSAATWNLDLFRDHGDDSQTILASLARDLIGEYDPIAIVTGGQAGRAVSAPANSPVVAVGRRIVDAWARQVYHDRRHTEEKREKSGKDIHDRMSRAAFDEFNGLLRYVGGMPSQTLGDVLIQLNASAHLADYIDGSENNLDDEQSRDLEQIIAAIAAAIRVLLTVPDILPVDFPREDLEIWGEIKFPADIPETNDGARP